ncbi:MAG: DUF4236 domain-containing protein [Rhodospirillales bacterium]|nr:DUF4236 domain-containing protein [Rhodospirillales bacterium]MBR9816357.1 DUF4236 domain-containing protein [Rhodospirillales bacterium]
MKFRKSFKVAPGLRLNVGKTRSSLSIGGKGVTTNISKRGVRTTVGIPGSGLSQSFSSSSSSKTKAHEAKQTCLTPPNRKWSIWKMIGYFLLILFAFSVVRTLFGI